MDAFLTNTALKQYERLNEPMLSRINDAIDGLEQEPPFLIETDLTDEENAMIEESLAEYRADPSGVTPWRKVRRS